MSPYDMLADQDHQTHRKPGLCLLLSKRPNFSSFDAVEMFDLARLGAVSFNVLLLLF